MPYRCPNCGWEGDDPTDVDALNIKTCPECVREVEPVGEADASSEPEYEPVTDQEPPEMDDSDDEWEWNPTIRGGRDGPVLNE